MEFKRTEERYIEEALRLAQEEYRTECSRCPDLIKEDFSEKLKSNLTYLFGSKYGRVALEDGKLIGYIVFEGPIDGFFGLVKGAFSPLGGSAFSGKDRGRLASMLYENLSSEMAQDGVCCHGLSLYAHDEEIGRSFVMNGFGIRCSDAVLKLKGRQPNAKQDERIELKELFGEERRTIDPLRRGLAEHIYSAPIFFPTNLDDDNDWYEEEGLRIFAARLRREPGDELWKKGDAIGFISTRNEAETFMTEHEKMPNICGAYFNKEYRGMGVAAELLDFVCRTSEENGMEYLGVDCETLNPTALRFWGKHFQNYTYSYVRRLDERVVGYEKYFNEKWPE